MAAATTSGRLADWAERSARRRACTAACGPEPGWLQFVFYGRVSTEDWQDPVMPLALLACGQCGRRDGTWAAGRPTGTGWATPGRTPNKVYASWGRRAHRLEPDPDTAPVVAWMFAQRLAGHSVARITRALNDAGIPCPSAADPKRNPHRTGTAWTLRTVAAILANPRYTGRQVWNRQRTDFDLVDPANTGLGHRPVQRWNLPTGWVISARPAHPAIISEADYIAAQRATAPRRPAGPATRRYLLAGLLACGTCGRRLESAWSNGKPAYRCRHGYTSATGPTPGRPANLHVRGDQILPRLAALAILHADNSPALRCGGHPSAQVTAPAQAADLIDRLQEPTSRSSTTLPRGPYGTAPGIPQPSPSANASQHQQTRKERNHQAQHPPWPEARPG